ncbi:mechanosensitive ion channel family protein [Pseudohalioglobus lutimaris]|uniref:Small-conductance mechanosensitive channel n=1 Tax=Pseudohalioglobus lutimaris TaxID=1737061 RepID=A0A2N5X865_9GAMM|nr:mechanosensitive ion channel family protein [Pseudohalioglobus lutimaris]PLW70671.1 mechanosensitive ion channel protein MscS [Pseudohalioglobus lutimaris]
MPNTVIWSYLPVFIVLPLVLLGLGVAHYVLLARNKELGSEARLPRQLVLLVLTILSVILLIVVAPIQESTRNQILGLLGIVLSGVAALSAAPFVTNFMAAVMLRVTKPFGVGNFIRVGDLYGKVSERGIFDTEIQTENRELVAIPNATFISQSVTVVRSSGVIVWTKVSLGYDLGHSTVEPLMLEAAEKAGLMDPYVHVMELGDFAITYKVCGLLVDVESALTARSELNRQLLNTLHAADVEIASPSITRHINQADDVRMIPSRAAPMAEAEADATRVKAEEIVFDKAREIERLGALSAELELQLSELSATKEADTDGQASLAQSLEKVKAELKALREDS